MVTGVKLAVTGMAAELALRRFPRDASTGMRDVLYVSLSVGTFPARYCNGFLLGWFLLA